LKGAIVSQRLGFLYPFATAIAAYTVNYIMGFLNGVRLIVAFFTGEQFAHFVTQPVVFSALCALLVAVIQSGTRLTMWLLSNDYRQRAITAERKLQDAIRQGLIA